jgi:hypothetical protein
LNPGVLFAYPLYSAKSMTGFNRTNKRAVGIIFAIINPAKIMPKGESG